MSPRGWFISRAVVAFSLFAALCGVATALAPAAGADAFGQIQKLGEPLAAGKTEAEWLASPKSFFEPGPLGVDPGTGNVYVIDNSPTKENARLQEFSPSGELLAASAPLPRPEVAEVHSTYTGVAIDPSYPGGGRLYLIEVAWNEVLEQPVGTKLLVYSTTPAPGGTGQPGTLEPVSGLSAGLALPDATSPDVLFAPQQITVEPSSHHLLISGRASSTETAYIARFEVASTAHELGRYVGGPNTSPVGVVVSRQTGKIYTEEGGTNRLGKFYEVAPDLGSSTELPALAVSGGGGGGANAGTKVLQGGAGPNLALSPDGETLYYSEKFEFKDSQGNGTGVINYQIRGVSLATGKTTVLYGKGETTCAIHNQNAAFEAGPDGELWVVDPYLKKSGVVTGSYLLEFGPDGSGCPIPNPRFSVNAGTPEETALGVQVGQHLKLHADTSELHGATATMFEWDLDGSGRYATHVDPATSTEEEVCFEETDPSTTIGLRIALTGGAVEEVPPVTKSVTVTSQPPTALLEGPTEANAGESVAFDGSRSFHIDCSTTGSSNSSQTYSWNFGDGSAEASGATPTHSFAAAGTYPVKLRVTDHEGLVGETEQSVTVNSANTGGGGETTTPPPANTTPPVGTTPPQATPPKATKPKQTPEQKALAVCAKKHGKAKAACVKATKKKFAKKKHGAKK